MATYSAYSRDLTASLTKVPRTLEKGPVYNEPRKNVADEGIPEAKLILPSWDDGPTYVNGGSES